MRTLGIWNCATSVADTARDAKRPCRLPRRDQSFHAGSNKRVTEFHILGVKAGGAGNRGPPQDAGLAG